ncbi:MAG: hypothetical protein OEV89_04555 [Desulfobulbaceae bacterium]|nr:hypothetical protein [Desulfobulbaceae bacterium]HIJ90018.1 hypothetical protein [Deltaproteobacteria bacterium]
MNGLPHSTPRAKALMLWLPAAALAGLACALPRIPQPQHYHEFADQRTIFWVPNFLNTSSNILFVLAGLAGLRFLHSETGRDSFLKPREALPYALFFFAVILTGFASGYYHLAPDNDRLMWDRAAITLALVSWFDAILCERVTLTTGLRLLPLMFTAGLGSVAYWGLSELHGRGDLRAYGLIQCYPILLIPLLLRLYPPRYTGDKDILTVIGLYLIALLCDFNDRRIATLIEMISGHTTKHLLAALSAYWVVIRLKQRRIL